MLEVGNFFVIAVGNFMVDENNIRNSTASKYIKLLIDIYDDLCSE